MDVGQALIKERTFDCVVSVCVCVCALHFLCFICYSLDRGRSCDFIQIYLLILHQVVDTWTIFLRCAVFTFKLDGMLTLLDV